MLVENLRVHQRDPALEPLVGEVGEEPSQLLGREHPLVDDRPSRQRREVDARARVLHALAHDKAAALEGIADGSAGPARPRSPAAQARKTCENLGATALAPSPAAERSTGTSRHPRTSRPSSQASLRNEVDGSLSCSRLAREKRHPCAVAPRLGEIEACNLANRAGAAAVSAHPLRHRCRGQPRTRPGGRGSRAP